ncbi:MAG: DNA-protecting protein DprA [Ruminococcaceae bacterium]|nr:DNA-protecting protein DprA [Oscillospiraceae bacterium]
MDHEISWVAVSLALGPRSHLLKPLLRRFGTPEALLAAGREAILAEIPDIGKGTLSSLCGEDAQQMASRTVYWCHQNGVRILVPDREYYPTGLWEIAEPPAVLYCKGKLPLPTGVPSVGIVGTRRTDAYGERVAYKLSFELAAAGATVISGMAQGADGIAAAAALDAGGHTVAVLGCGIDVIYPRQHERLFREIATFGTVLTEFTPGTRPNGWNFPVRNRLISALSDALVVTEAAEDSGSLITARYALLQGKTLFAVPGDVDNPRSVGTNGLIRSGALMALSAEDVLAHFRFLYPQIQAARVPAEAMQYTEATREKLRAHGVPTVLDREEQKPAQIEKTDTVSAHSAQKPAEQTPAASTPTPVSEEVLQLLDPRQRELYGMLPEGTFSLDHLTAKGIPSGEAAAALTVLELYGILQSCPGGIYRKL